MKYKIEIHPKYGPLFIINPESRFPFTFGVSKAKLLSEHAKEIAEFVSRYAPGPIALDTPAEKAS